MMARVWTDDLPKCEHTSVAVSGSDSKDTLSFHCEINDHSHLYGVFEPHNGVEAARFIIQRMAAEVIFNRVIRFTNASDEDIRDLLSNAFVSVEKAYAENYDELIAERTSLQYELQTGVEPHSYDRILYRLKEIDMRLSEGVTVVIALLYYNKLFVANVGSCRALLCRTDENSVLRVIQLSSEHSLQNEDELLRLSQIGINVDRLRGAQTFGNQSDTRCLGNYLVKGLYRAFPDLRAASSEPVIATAEVHGPIVLDESCRFLVLVSSLVCKKLQELRGSTDQINKQLTQLIVENFRNQSHFENISPSVLVEIDNQYRQHCGRQIYAPMRLLIKNFNYMTRNIEESRANEVKTRVHFNPIVQNRSPSPVYELELSNNSTETNRSQISTKGTTSSETSSDIYPSGRIPYDKDKKIKGYVDFTCFYENVEKAKKNGTLPDFSL